MSTARFPRLPLGLSGSRAMRSHLAMPLLALATCTEGGIGAPRIPDPTPQEAANALVRALSRTTEFVVYGGGGPGVDCVDGRDAAGRLVRTCKACEVLLTVRYQGIDRQQLIIERSQFSLAFRRAISTGQPDVAPVDDTQGVWVGAAAASPVARTITSAFRPLTDNVVRPLGIGIQRGFSGGDLVCLPSGLCVLPESRQVIDMLASDKAASIMRDIVGGCDGSAVPLAEP